MAVSLGLVIAHLNPIGFIVGPALAAEHFPDSHLYSDARCRD